MSLAAATTSVNCTSCGAGLDVLGGGRVMVHICPYCGAELDAQDNYAVIAKFDGLQRPDSPFRIGMSGKIRGADYTVIGMLEFRERYRGQTWTWIDHQLYSPTHGYAWLTIEDGHLVFTRRYRRPVWLSEGQVERANHPPTITIDGERYRYYETSTGEITFAEGEFTWAPKIGDKTTTVTVLSDEAMLGFSQTNQEREVYRSELVDSAEVSASFGVSNPPVPQGVHPMTPYQSGGNDRFMLITSLIALVACIVLAIFFDTRNGTLVGDPIVLETRQIPAAVPITIPNVTGPVRLTFDGTPYVAPTLANPPSLPVYARASIDLAHPDGRSVPEAPRRAVVTVGGQRQGAAAGSRNHTELVFPSAMAGDYQLNLRWSGQGPTSANTRAGFEGEITSASQLHFSEGNVTIRTYAGISSGYWLYRLAVVFLILAIVALLGKWNFNRKRWSGSDWTSED
ncbi:DUF4178 domain-containing protein [Nioella sp. MMSF_3534]|uniref:DUF4178 domain-containing protein n=1 Tax=Nioella sp. MMSF_3534 TaxID=3046720 RepID=UPI00273E8CA7|nr:DUF4178 domain-containing protein [Nioella sp. MMSF_3534]